MIPSFDLLHVVMAVVGVAIALIYQRYGMKPSPGAPDGAAPVVIPGRPILTMLLAMLHDLVDGQGGDPNPLTPLALQEKSVPLDLQAELMTLVNKLRSQQSGAPAAPNSAPAQPTSGVASPRP